ncbi:2-(1,2-epoxy-1,2-dihydrophenyl)acetyl-CoA isomerase [Methylovirgula ligni]|uniref:Short chain enoyl-CoA hydratase /enoyl-CoA hydratase n=2 Tax=Methylovirgula ligni TaxID=569860 RepID=A0A3D9Z4K1_9HYPH|nr:2-(1,2-epoxy-1,2-dihydrophenyl)acetyl-CoA isomerase [Methylovirgula ligni]REF89160.1 short chain enoyl-CoA hydratase /enoyl-CoA hydratase [Methylovirgula ligni]
MQFETILFSLEASVARLVLNRPQRLNAFTVTMHHEVAVALDSLLDGHDARVLLLTGSGRGFCAGQDLSERNPESAEALDLGANIDAFYNPLIKRLTELPLPVVCAVNGVAAGAGVNIALACDIVVARKSAQFIQSFANIGLLPDSAGTWILPRLIGPARATALMMTGDPLNAAQAADWGMIWQAIDDEAFEEHVESLVRRLAVAPTRAMVAIKNAIKASSTASLADQLDRERDLQRMLGRTEDYREGVSAFKEKRKPNFVGR